MQIQIKDFLKEINSYIEKDKEFFIIGIAGGSGSGKSFLADKIKEKLSESVALNMDDYIIPEKVSSLDNWDLPEIWNLDLFRKHLLELKKGNVIEKPVYNFVEHQIKICEKFKSGRVIIVEGLYALHEKIVDLIDLKIFVDADEDVRLNRRIKRDATLRGRTKEEVLKKWNETVEPTYRKMILPEKDKADIVVVNN